MAACFQQVSSYFGIEADMEKHGQRPGKLMSVCEGIAIDQTLRANMEILLSGDKAEGVQVHIGG